MKTPPQPKAPRARVMYETAHRRGGTIILHTRTEPEDTPVSVLPRSKEAQEAMIYAMAVAHGKASHGGRNFIPNAFGLECMRKSLAVANLVEKE